MVRLNQTMTLQDYLGYDDGTDNRYELVNGELIAMPPESDLNNQIASFLFATFLRLGVPYYCLRMKTQIAVSGSQATAREPGFLVLSEAAAAALTGAFQCVITYDMPPPRLVVEVVSPQQGSRDYRYKRTEYAGRQIPEYWIVDPGMQKITVLTWVEGAYEEAVYTDSAKVVSPQFETLDLVAQDLLTAGR